MGELKAERALREAEAEAPFSFFFRREGLGSSNGGGVPV